ARPGAALRGRLARGPGRLPRRSGGLALESRRPAVTRRAAFLIAAALLVVILVGGRWLALETAERAWAATFAGGAALVEARTLARLLHALVLLFSITWTTGNVFVVYRAIGSVQMPHRLGDLEISEAGCTRATTPGRIVPSCSPVSRSSSPGAPRSIRRRSWRDSTARWTRRCSTSASRGRGSSRRWRSRRRSRAWRGAGATVPTS